MLLTPDRLPRQPGSWSARFLRVQDLIVGAGALDPGEFCTRITGPMVAAILGYASEQSYTLVCQTISRWVPRHGLDWYRSPAGFIDRTIPVLRAALSTPEYIKFFGAITGQEYQAWVDLHGSAGLPGDPTEWTDARNILYLDRYLSPEPFKRAQLFGVNQSLENNQKSTYQEYLRAQIAGLDIDKVMGTISSSSADKYLGIVPAAFVDPNDPNRLSPALTYSYVSAPLPYADISTPGGGSRLTRIAKMNEQLFAAVVDFSDEEIAEFRSTLALALRLTEEVQNVTEEETDAVVAFLQERRGYQKAEPVVKGKVRILEPQYVVDPEPEE